MKTKYLNVISQIIVIIFLLLINYLLLIKGIYILKKDENYILLIFELIIFLVTLIILINLNREPFNIELHENEIVLTRFPFPLRNKISINEISGFSSSIKKYRYTEHEILIIYLKNSKKYHLIEYNFKDFQQILGKLKSKKIKYFGKEPLEYKFCIIRKYKYENI